MLFRSPNFKEGDLVRGFGEWADYANVDSDSFLVLEEGLDREEAYLSALGLNGWTAYVGVMEVGKPKPGENSSLNPPTLFHVALGIKCHCRAAS